MKLDTNKLEQAIQAFENSRDVFEAKDNQKDEKLMKTIRSGLVQDFEVAFDLCWKFLQ